MPLGLEENSLTGGRGPPVAVAAKRGGAGLRSPWRQKEVARASGPLGRPPVAVAAKRGGAGLRSPWRQKEVARASGPLGRPPVGLFPTRGFFSGESGSFGWFPVAPETTATRGHRCGLEARATGVGSLRHFGGYVVGDSGRGRRPILLGESPQGESTQRSGFSGGLKFALQRTKGV